jgi:putative copper resistance protein D
MLALGVAIIAAGQLRRRPSGAGIILTLASATALASLVWSGHAAASEGLAGTIHRAADALHMIAAGIWLGAIAAFLILLRPATDDDEQPRYQMAAQGLERFAQVGTGCVIAIAATGLINFEMIVGLQRAGSMLHSTYGYLLIAKFLLFAGMLALAALNRWRLTPALAAADGETSRAAIRRSIALEASAAAGILALVAILGILEP